ncbi:hypothetical protein [Nocardia fluminea]|uniref:hypothetical protein n=1 Tax=Nocardia fluminea TaxID=134984 RepID=UPI0036616F29
MIHFVAPPAAAAVRRALAITDPATRIVIDDNNRTVYCDNTDEVADAEVRVYNPATDLYENLYVLADEVADTIATFRDDHDVDTVEVVVNADWVLALAA